MKDLNRTIHRVWPLYGAAFMMSLSLNSWWTCMPFIIRNIGGTEAHVGYAWAANMFGYLICLLLTGLFCHGHNPRNTTRFSSGTICISIVLVGIIIYIISSHAMKGNLLLIWLVIALGAVAGGATSLFWPFLMSWVSEDLKGEFLNSRLGRYNSSWSASVIIGPLIGGALVEQSDLLPAIFVSFTLVLCFLLLNFSVKSNFHKVVFEDNKNQGDNNQSMENILRFRKIARIGLFCSWACIGLARSQYALVFTEAMEHSKTLFGALITIFAFFNFLSLTLSGRNAFWHFKPFFLLCAQTTLIISLVMIIFSKSLFIVFPAFVILGCGFGFMYSSHLYYGTCGAKKRSVQMAIHEATISLGIVVGSGSGGYIVSNFGTYQPYWFMLVLVTIGLFAQVFLMNARAKQKTDS